MLNQKLCPGLSAGLRAAARPASAEETQLPRRRAAFSSWHRAAQRSPASRRCRGRSPGGEGPCRAEGSAWLQPVPLAGAQHGFGGGECHVLGPCIPGSCLFPGPAALAKLWAAEREINRKVLDDGSDRDRAPSVLLMHLLFSPAE